MKNQKRQTQLSWLVGLSALSAVALYIVQGALATGADIKTFPAWFWTVDYVLWGFRALIEARVIVYLFSTDPQTPRQEFILVVFEVALIALIALTVGPALRAAALGQQMVDTVAPWVFTAWSFGIASYTPLMVGAAGYAYRVQKDDAGGVDAAALERELAQTKEAYNRAHRELGQIENKHDEQIATVRKASALLESFGAKDRATLYLMAQGANGDGVSAAEVARVLGVSETTARNAARELEETT